MASGLTVDLCTYLVGKWYREELGREASDPEIAVHVKVIGDKGVSAAFNGIYRSAEAKKFRARVGRSV